MRKIALFFTLCISALLINGCGKQFEEGDFAITSIQYEFTDLNDCTLSDGGSNGSSLTLKVGFEGISTEEIYGLWIESVFNNGGDPGAEDERDINVYMPEAEIRRFSCVRYGSSATSLKYTIRIIHVDGTYSKPVTIDVPRPLGGN